MGDVINFHTVAYFSRGPAEAQAGSEVFKDNCGFNGHSTWPTVTLNSLLTDKGTFGTHVRGWEQGKCRGRGEELINKSFPPFTLRG